MNNIKTFFKKIYSLLILTFLFFLISTNITYSKEKIGSIVNLKNEVYAVNVDGEKRLLDLYDEVFIEDEILTNELSTATVQYNDSSTIIIKQSSSFKVTEFNITGLKDVFFARVEKGSVIIESGKIAKKTDGSMIIELPTMTLDIKGTRFNIENNPDGTSNVSLAEDSFGNVGIINISSEDEVKTLFDTGQVVSVNAETGISERPKTDDEKKELIDISNDLIEASSIDENAIQKNLEEKLLNGNLLDANGDGVIDASDIEVIKEGIKLEKQEKLDFIVDNSTGENTEFLSQVLNKSDEASIGQSMDKIFETKNDLLNSVITNLANEDNAFLTKSNSEANNAIKEKIYTQMLSDVDGNDNVALIGDIISRSDSDTVERMVNFVEISDANNEGTNLSLQILSSVADARSLNDVDSGFEGQAEVDRLMEEAVFNAANSDDGAMYLANIMSKGSEDSIYMMMDTIGQVGETFSESTLALEVLSSMADSESFDDIDFGDQGQDLFDNMMEDAVYAAANSDDGAEMLGSMMANGSEESMGMMMNTISMVGETDPNSTLALEVLSSMAENDYLDDIDFGDQGQDLFDNMMEDAVYAAANSDDGAEMLASVMTNSDVDTVGAIMDYISDVSDNDPNSSFAAEVLSEVVTAAVTGDTYFDTETTDMYNNLVDTIAFTDTATSVDDNDIELYDAEGFAFAPPYYHKDTGTIYNSAGFDRDGNEDIAGGGSVAWTTTSASFPTTLTENTGISSITLNATGVGTVFYTFTGTFPDGIDLNGDTVSGTPNTEQAATSVTITATDEDNNTSDLVVSFPAVDSAGGSVAWTTTSASFPATLTEDDDISSVTLEAEGVGTVSFSYSGTFPDGIDLNGDTVSGTPSGAQGATNVTITATDEDNNTSDLVVSFPAVDAAGGGSYDENGFSTVSPFYHRDTDTLYDNAGYNSAGYNYDGYDAASNYDSAYDENISPA